MVKRYGYTWEYLTVVLKPNDADGNPVAPTETWTSFECDVQTSSGRFVTNSNGDKIAVSYSLFTKVNTGLSIGGKVKDENGTEYIVLMPHDYKINFEIWV